MHTGISTKCDLCARCDSVCHSCLLHCPYEWHNVIHMRVPFTCTVYSPPVWFMHVILICIVLICVVHVILICVVHIILICMVHVILIVVVHVILIFVVHVILIFVVRDTYL